MRDTIFDLMPGVSIEPGTQSYQLTQPTHWPNRSLHIVLHTSSCCKVVQLRCWSLLLLVVLYVYYVHTYVAKMKEKLLHGRVQILSPEWRKFFVTLTVQCTSARYCTYSSIHVGLDTLTAEYTSGSLHLRLDTSTAGYTYDWIPLRVATPTARYI